MVFREFGLTDHISASPLRRRRRRHRPTADRPTSHREYYVQTCCARICLPKRGAAVGEVAVRSRAEWRSERLHIKVQYSISWQSIIFDYFWF